MINADELAGRVVLVTGASSGLGAHFANLFGRAGAKVALCARRKDRLEGLAKEIGASAAAVEMDVTDEASIVAAFDAAERALGPVDVLVNNAGMNARGPALEISAEDLDRILDVNLRGPYLCAREAARRMIARNTDSGRIINIASIGGLKPLPGIAAYCATKAAVVMLTRSFAAEWMRKGINVNAICPGYIETELNSDFLAEEVGQKMIQGFPRRRLMRASDLDDTMLFFAGARSAYVTGSVFTLDDGQTL